MHQIKRHTLTIDCSSPPFGKEVQHVVADLMEKEFYPQLEQLLDRYPMADATWIIDAIEITIPSVTKKNWKNELVTKALNEIEAFLNKNYKAITSSSNEHVDSYTALIPNAHQAEFLFIDYLKTGIFNRSALYNTVLDIEKQLAKTTFKVVERREAFCNELVKVLLEHPNSLIRFIYSVSHQTKTSIRKEGIGFLFDIASVLKNEKPDKRFFSSSHEYTNWISLLEWSLYFYKTYKANNVIEQFVALSLLNFQLNATEINRFLVFLIRSSKGKIANELQDIIVLFTEKMNTFANGEVSFKTEAVSEVNLKTEAVSEVNLKTDANKNQKSKTGKSQTYEKNPEVEKKLHEKIEMVNSLSESNDSVEDKSNNSLNLSNDKDKKEAKATNDSTTAANSKLDNPKLLQNAYTDPNSLNLSEEKLQKSTISDDVTQFRIKSAAIDAHTENTIDLQDTSRLSIESDNQNDKEDTKFAYRRYNLEEDTNAASTTLDETLKNSKRVSENPIYIENAGLIILHPFLIHLFEQLKLCKNEEWTSKRNQYKAVLITQHLITGSTVFFENDLVLNKIVCGLKADAVIDVSIKLSAKDSKEAKGLLEAVLSYWKPLNNSSIDSLRETFLQRNGKLVFKNETSIELWVEQKGFDVLMAQIPWGIGMVKTPWMSGFIDCHWN